MDKFRIKKIRNHYIVQEKWFWFWHTIDEFEVDVIGFGGYRDKQFASKEDAEEYIKEKL